MRSITLAMTLIAWCIGTNVHANNDSALLTSAKKGDLSGLQKILNSGASVNAANEVGITSLMWACSENFCEMAKFLIEKGANVNANDDYGRTPLFFAANKGASEIAQSLLERGSEVNARERVFGITPLTIAFAKHQTAVVKKLLDYGADANNRDINGETTLMWGTKDHSPDIIVALLSKGADPNVKDNEGVDALMRYAILGNHEVVKVLLSAGANPNARYPEFLKVLDWFQRVGAEDLKKQILTSSVTKYVKLYGELQEYSVPTWLKNHDPASGKARTLEKRKEFHSGRKKESGTTLLMWASGLNRPDVVESLVQAGADVNARDGNLTTPLMWASLGGNSETVKLLLSNKASPAVIEMNGATAKDLLSMAISLSEKYNATERKRFEKLSEVKAIIQEQLRLNENNEEVRQELLAACKKGDLSGVRYLLEQGGDDNTRDPEFNATLLHWACYLDNPHLLLLLLENGANIEAVNLHGQTPLIVSAAMGNEFATRHLLYRGAEKSVRDKEERTAFDWAEAKGFRDLLQLVRFSSTNTADNAREQLLRGSKGKTK